MKRNRLFILVGLGGLLALAAGASTASAAVVQPKDGEDGGDTKGEGEDDLPDLEPPPPPAPPPVANEPDYGPVPNMGQKAMLDGFFGNTAGIARGLYLLGFGDTSANLAADIKAGGSISAVAQFQKAYDELAQAGRDGKGNIAFGQIPSNLGAMNNSRRKNGSYDGIVGYETLAGLYNALRYFSPGPVWNLTKLKVSGDDPITQRSNMRGFLQSL